MMLELILVSDRLVHKLHIGKSQGSHDIGVGENLAQQKNIVL